MTKAIRYLLLSGGGLLFPRNATDTYSKMMYAATIAAIASPIPIQNNRMTQTPASITLRRSYGTCDLYKMTTQEFTCIRM